MINKKIVASVLGGTAMAVSVGMAQAATMFTFDPTSVAAPGGPSAVGPFQADEMTWRSLGQGNVVITDTDGNGSLDAGGVLGDSFLENVTVFQTQFFKNGLVVPVSISGINTQYEIFGVATLTGNSGLQGPNVVATFDSSSNATLYFDSNVNGVLDAASASVIGQLTNTNGDCVFTGSPSGFAEGSCGMSFDFDAAGVSDAGVWTLAGTDLGDLGAKISLDIDVDSINPAVQLAYAGGPGSSQTVGVTHDGSSKFSVPEPSILALFGIGLIGLGRVHTRKES